MLEKLVTTLTLTGVTLTMGTTYAWTQGAFDPQEADFGTVAERVVAPGDGTAPASGYGDYQSDVAPTATPTPRAAEARDGASPAPWQPVPLHVETSPLPQLVAAPRSTSTTTTGTTETTTTLTTGSGATTDTGGDAGGDTGGDGGSATGSAAGSGFRVASLNVLGSSLTRPGGGSPGYAPGTTRIAGAVKLLAAQRISVAGLQELQPDQAQTMQRLMPGWQAYPGTSLPGKRSGAESITWDSAVWKPVEKHLIAIPFMLGLSDRQMPYVLLEHRATGKRVWFSNVHFTPGKGARADAGRAVGTDRHVRLLNRLLATGDQVVATGDMNDHQRYFCRITSETAMVAAAGGSNTGGRCSPPRTARIDWILGSAGLRMHDYQMVRDAAVRAVTDHPMVFTGIDFR